MNCKFDSIKNIKKSFHDSLNNIYHEREIEAQVNLVLHQILNYKSVLSHSFNDTNISITDQKRIENILDELKTNKPLQYILGSTEFFGLPFKVDENVLIPRSETEELVDWIIKDYANIKDLNILDIGSGSGCISICLAKHLSHSKVDAIDISSEAICIAKENATINNVGVNFIHCDVFDNNVENIIHSNYDIIVSNPPYVMEKEKEFMHKNVLDYEPAQALFVSNDEPLIFYKRIKQIAKNTLKKNGAVYFEINESLNAELINLFSDTEFSNKILRKDLNDKPRMLKILNL